MLCGLILLGENRLQKIIVLEGDAGVGEGRGGPLFVRRAWSGHDDGVADEAP